jgi:lipoprotein-anchoring transpeptidase ErfK/SrfK
LHLTHTLIVVDRARRRMSVLRDGRRVWAAPVAVGKPSTPTPAGDFWIREAFAVSDRSSGYWPFAFGTSDYSSLTDWPGGGVVGIHGPYFAAQDIPGQVSHGCIRLRVADDEWLGRHIGVGTPLRVI